MSERQWQSYRPLLHIHRDPACVSKTQDVCGLPPEVWAFSPSPKTIHHRNQNIRQRWTKPSRNTGSTLPQPVSRLPTPLHRCQQRSMKHTPATKTTMLPHEAVSGDTAKLHLTCRIRLVTSYVSQQHSTWRPAGNSLQATILKYPSISSSSSRNLQASQLSARRTIIVKSSHSRVSNGGRVPPETVSCFQRQAAAQRCNQRIATVTTPPRLYPNFCML